MIFLGVNYWNENDKDEARKGRNKIKVQREDKCDMNKRWSDERTRLGVREDG